ncbi:MAG: hypothetical protein M1820_004313 [Bogoriella megaspora]|nr:MAG: hypothetical protein M1820_004313 [Bogoriella megaspora]
MSTTIPAFTGTDGDVTSFIPLTTAYTAPSGCSSDFRLDGPSLMAYDPAYGVDIDTRASCQPPAVSTWWGQLPLPSTIRHTVISIGPVVCPRDFVTVGTSVIDRTSTTVICCPSNYYLANQVPGTLAGDCLSNVSSGMVLTFGSTPSDQSTAWTVQTTTLTASSTVGAIAVCGWNIGNVISTTAATSMSSSSPSNNPSTGIITTSPPPTSTSTPPNTLSAGAKAGISVGSILGTLGIFAFIATLIILRWRTQHKKAGHTNDETVPNTYGSKAELPAISRQRVLPPEMTGDTEIHELPERTTDGYIEVKSEDGRLLELPTDRRAP